VALYPVADLLNFSEDTWRFEEHYFDSLIGSMNEHGERYVERSPITHVDKFDKPILLLHGDADNIVPVSHSTGLADALSRSGCKVDFHVYEGEGHGWRKPSNQADELERIGQFLRQHGLITGKYPSGEGQ
jgi:dipeptidyl aminopeptidase/acylaminoacyl peptidase